MVLRGVLSVQEAYAAIDLDTLVFLLGMTVIVAYLEIPGFFEILELFILKRARSRSGLLLLVVASSGLLSALFMNETICLMFTPVLVRLIRRLELPPAPYLIGSAANLIVLESAEREGVHLGFFEYLKVGLPLTLLTIGLGVLILSLRF